MCSTIMLASLLSNVENLPKIGPAALLSRVQGGGGALCGVARGSGRTGREGGPPLVRPLLLSLSPASLWAPGSLWTCPLRRSQDTGAHFPRTLGCL